MRIKPPKDLHMQCSICGVPIEVVDGQRFETADGFGFVAVAEPCGHQTTFPPL